MHFMLLAKKVRTRYLVANKVIFIMKKITLSFVSLVVLLFLSPVKAQEITWEDISQTVDLPDGVKLFFGTRASPALKIWYYEVDMTNPDIALVPYFAEDGTETTTEFAKRAGVYGAINGGYFGGSSSYSTLIQPGQVLAQNVAALTRNSQSYPIIRSMFGIKEDKSMAVDWIYHFNAEPSGVYRFDSPMPYEGSNDAPLPAPKQEDGELYSDVYMGVGGGPVLVKGDTVKVTYNEEIFWGSGVGNDNRDPRTAAGYTADGKAILMVADGRQTNSQGVSLPEMAQIMIDLGATEAINLDGGGSSTIVLGDSLLNRPQGGTFQRSIPTFLAITHVDSIPKEPVIGYEQVIDTEFDSAEVTGEWATTANPGYYGESISLITFGGDGSKTVTYKAALPNEGTYDLYGWWVASFNRSKQSAYIVQHLKGTDTLYIDQSVNNAQWVKLGQFEFSGTNSDRVIISNLGGDTENYVVADAVRFVGISDEVTSNEEEIFFDDLGFKLNPAYPNPFNPATNISFEIPASGQVNLSVYSITGQKVAEVFNGYRSLGIHTLTWNASQMASGVYVVRINYTGLNNSWSDTQKITLIK